MFSWKRPARTAWYAIVLWLLTAGCALALTQVEDPREVSWNITALMVTYDNERQLYIAEDNVVITGGRTRLEADYVEFNNKTKDAFAQGNVLFISGGDTITCNAMQVNLLTEKGTINKGTIFIQDGNYYISGDKLRKTGEFTYDAAKGAITTCDGDSPDWKITGRNIKVTVEGYGRAAHTTLWAKKMPVFYSPYLVFPVKNKRQTGLLFPMVGTSDRKGFEYEQPLFLALSRNTDATVYAHYMSDRGLKVAGEFRYVLSPESKGMMVVDYLNDDKLGDGTEANKNYSFDSTAARTNKDRYWFRMKHDQDLGYGFNAKLDVDWVSDADYLQEFKDGFTGFDTTDQRFEAMFGRSLDDYDKTIRKNSLLVNKSWDHYNLNIQTLWYDNVLARQEGNTIDNTTLQQLPSVEFDASRQQIGATGLYYTLDSEFRSFYRQETQTVANGTRGQQLINGQRMDIHPRLYYPMNLGKSFFFEPYLGVRETVWNTDNFTDTGGNADNLRSRGLYDAGAQLSTSLSRIFTPGTDFAEKIRHEIVPKLEYGYVPYTQQDDLPYFDGLDTIAENNMVTWSLTNTFTARRKHTDAEGNSTNEYSELAWFKLYQSYDIKTERDDESTTAKPWQALRLKYELNPFTYLSSNGDIALDPYTRHFTEVKVGATLKDNRGDSINTSYRYATNSPYVSNTATTTTVATHSWYTRFNARITEALLAYYSFEENLDDKTTIETRAGFELERDCWGLIVEFREESAEKAIAFLVTLKGIGEFGTK
ncbi:MAG: LPS-assembly protein LptD [Desulfobacter sp.]|nr:MAG: LPS-assembly protein LptD [Desulfobacter sp.]